MEAGGAEGGLDGAALAVSARRFEGVVESMLHTLFRTGRSGVINTAHDFSCCLLTADHRLVAAARSIPIHVLVGPDAMAASMTELHSDLRPGDAFLHNSPYHGCSHAADHSILVPVFDDEGRHRFTVLAKAHQADCGNSEPTTLMAGAPDVYAEGALIFPCVRVQRGYEDVEDVIRMCRLRIRVPDQWWGDYLALLGAARVGERELVRLGRERSWDELDEACERWFHYSEAMMRDAIARLPAAELTVDTRHDPAPGVPDGIPLRVTVRVDPRREAIQVDLRDNPDCQPCGLNLTEATARTAAMVGVFNGLGRRVPTNAGSFRALDVQLRENCVVGIPRHPASCSVATTNLTDRVANAVQRALAELADGVGMAELGLMQPPSTAVISGRDGGRPFINMLFLLETGGAASPRCDAWLTAATADAGGMLYRDSVEIDEQITPIRVHAQRVIPDSEGAGRFRGAPAGYVEYGPVGGDLEMIFASDGTVNPPQGVRGGGAGAPADQYIRASGDLRRLEPCSRLVLHPGESVVSVCCGGGGYGDPADRDPELVRRDLSEGWITPERARATYGVAVAEDGTIDRAETERLREGPLGSPDGVPWSPRGDRVGA